MFGKILDRIKKKNASSPEKNTHSIDIVYLWCDLNDENFKKKKEECSCTPPNTGFERQEYLLALNKLSSHSCLLCLMH